MKYYCFVEGYESSLGMEIETRSCIDAAHKYLLTMDHKVPILDSFAAISDGTVAVNVQHGDRQTQIVFHAELIPEYKWDEESGLRWKKLPRG